ncbi:MAG: tRNA (adenosine(37)-N6)-dimethylallyltransferase MiaA [Eubacteriales bacterium]|nr:tRNA (adenosine(37)-N6)-dimethylallyltransferase MiaA [Eubacteriales bacterium]
MRYQEDAVLILAGPTASGKSSLAVNLAALLNAEIISADSMQIYRYMDIGTAKIMPEERQGIAHHLLDIVDPDQNFTLADWLLAARKKVKEIRASGKLPLICGGTGLYLDFLIEGLVLQDNKSEESEFKLEDKEKFRAKILQVGLDKAHQKIAELDPAAAAVIKENDEKRIVRFFERLELTGLTLSEHNARSQREAESIGQVFAYYLAPERELLYQRINLRAERIFAQGLIEEFKMLNLLFPDFTSSQAYQAIAYKEAEKLINGSESYAEAVSRLAQSTRNYAKRQLSWFRRKAYYQAVQPEQAKKIILAEFS